MCRTRCVPVPSLLVVGLLLAWAIQCTGEASIHTVFTTECGKYFTWQSMGEPTFHIDFSDLASPAPLGDHIDCLAANRQPHLYLPILPAGMVYSHRKAGQPGPLTRIMCCTDAEWAALPEEDRSIATTHVAPSFTVHPRTGDPYSAYNKPVAVIDWLARNNVTEEYVLIIDADMIMREPFLPHASGAGPGRAVAAYFGYMKGVNNKLALKHIPDVIPRNDSDAGPVGRRSDQVGGFTMMRVEDLRRMAPLWLKFTEDVRADPDAWELTGDAYSTQKGSKPWISEMYGYSYAAAKADVWHTCHHSAMLYPGYELTELPKVLHYGLLWEVKGGSYDDKMDTRTAAAGRYVFDKHWHYDFNPLKCPPWDLR
jgi:peptidyl serine alpha-galactosyltransferase